jgi:hypothetical protein
MGAYVRLFWLRKNENSVVVPHWVSFRLVGYDTV